MNEKPYGGFVNAEGLAYVGYINAKNKCGGNEYWLTKEKFYDRYFRVACCAAKVRSNKNSIEFDLTPEYLKSIFPEDGKCPVYGTPMSIFNERRKHKKPSLDRIVPTIGYVKGNVAWISLEANRLKNNASLSELEALVAYMKTINAQQEIN